MKNLCNYTLFFLTLLALTQSAEAVIVPSPPVTLTNGALADATQVMGNFNSLVTNINTNAAHNGANSDITSLTGLTTPLAPTYGGTNVFTGGISTGSGNAQVVATTLPTPIGLNTGDIVTFIAGFSNSSATTLNVDSTGVNTLDKTTPSGLAALAIGDIIVGGEYMAVWDGTEYNLLNPTPNTLASLAIGGGLINDGGELAVAPTVVTAATSFTVGTADRDKLFDSNASSGAVSVALPITLPDGFRVGFRKITHNITLTPTSPQNIAFAPGNQVSSLTITQDFSLIWLVWSISNNGWQVESYITGTLAPGTVATTQAIGDSTTNVATTAFANPASSIGANGYTKLPNGVIIEWGSDSSTTNPRNISFPLTFPNAVFSVVATSNNSNASIQAITAQSVSQFTVNQGNAGSGINWMAVGN